MSKGEIAVAVFLAIGIFLAGMAIVLIAHLVGPETKPQIIILQLPPGTQITVPK